MFNPRSLSFDAEEFVEHFKFKFAQRYESKIVLLQEKNVDPPRGIMEEEDLVLGGLRKPISLRALQKLFEVKNGALAYS